MENKPPFVKKWLISIRPFSLSASAMPVIFGTVLSVTYGEYIFKPGLFVLALMAMVILHSGANILSDVMDYRKGLDKEPNPVSGGVVRGIITQKEAIRASVVLLFIGVTLGFLLTYLVGIWLLVIGITGVLVGVFYTSETRLSLKYNGLGDLAVFLNFGILGGLGSWFVQSGELSWIPVIWTIPMATLVIAILHANNWRDIPSDKDGNIHTIASLLGDKGSERYYGYLIFGPFVMILAFIFLPMLFFNNLPALPLTFLLTLIALPLSIKLWGLGKRRKTAENPMDFVALDGKTAQLNLLFGLLCTVSLLANLLIVHLTS